MAVMMAEDPRSSTLKNERAYLKMIRVLELLRNHHPIIHANSIISFLLVANNPGLSNSEIEKRLGVDSGTASRSIGLFRERHKPNKSGLGWVVSKPDDRDARVVRSYLTPRGERIWKMIRDIMDEE
jgi:DNA-binding MarR family transcriptional regulator